MLFNMEKIIRLHDKMSNRIAKLCSINNFLIEEMHKKKSVKKRNLFTLTDKTADLYYNKVLFRGLKNLTSFSTFPCYFQGTLDSVMWGDLGDDGEQSIGYYNNNKYRDHDWSNEYALENCPEMTDDDKEKMAKYAKQLLKFMSKVINIIKSSRYSDSIKDLSSELRRCKKHFSVCIADLF
jgi:hypothetical protein